MYENIAVARVNKEVNGIELSFPSGKPAYEVLKTLKENGFRWHNQKQIWYARNTAEHIRAVEKYVDLAASDPSFGVTPGGTVDVKEIRRKRDGRESGTARVVAEIGAGATDSDNANRVVGFISDQLKADMKDWYLAKYPDDQGARDMDWSGVGTFRDLFDALDLRRDVYDAYPGDSLVRERLFSGLAEILGCDYDVIYKQWLGTDAKVGGLRRAIAGKYDLGFGHLGNGITVWNRLQEEHGDYKTVAHISPERTVTYYDKSLPEDVKQKIRDFAERENPTISATQNAPVFREPAGEIVQDTVGGVSEISGKHGVSTKQSDALAAGVSEVAVGDAEPKKEAKAACLADVYTSVGRGDVCRDSTVEGSLWSPVSGRGYYSDINACVWVNREGAHVVELDNAMKRGKVCKHYSIYAMGKDMHMYLFNECDVHTPKDLYDLVRSGRELPGDGRLSEREEKGVEVFSPFVAVKPLEKLPEKWKKVDLVKAIMSGQVFSGVLDQRLTDDYAYDAAMNFGTGRKIDLAGQAYDLVEGCRDCYIKTDGIDEKGIASIHFSYAGDMKTFLFDVNCDLAEGVRRREAAAQALEAHNLEVRSAVKRISAEEIDPCKVYQVAKVVEDSNSGKLSVMPEILQGFVLVDQLSFEEITEYKEAALLHDRLYEVADFFHRRDYAEDDSRIIDMGNWGQLCSGKAVEELTQEGVYLHIPAATFEKTVSFEAAKEDCQRFIDGHSHFMFGNKVDYTRSLEKLEAEEARVAPQKAVRKEPKSLADVIGFIEAKREFEKNQGSNARKPVFHERDR